MIDIFLNLSEFNGWTSLCHFGYSCICLSSSWLESLIPDYLFSWLSYDDVLTYMSQLHHVDGLSYSGVRQLLEANENYSKDFVTLIGCSGHVWGVVRD
jgi:hypothetical protein